MKSMFFLLVLASYYFHPLLANAEAQMQAAMVILGIQVLIGLVIAHFLGRYRQMGFGWCLFFCIFFTPIVGFIAVMLNSKYYDPTPKPSSTKFYVGLVMVVLFSIGIIGFLSNPKILSLNPNSIGLYIGFVGWGIYLIQRSYGVSFHDGQITKVE
ncbi:MAG TPA: hypothetical protein DCM08_09530 [Microscillaceae bacterium]|jgi:hypothetical protein|nr:hypothetical protein [Microscillaceae bacterium]